MLVCAASGKAEETRFGDCRPEANTYNDVETGTPRCFKEMELRESKR